MEKEKRKRNPKLQLYLFLGLSLLFGMWIFGYMVGTKVAKYELDNLRSDIARTAWVMPNATTEAFVQETQMMATVHPFQTELAELHITQTSIADTKATIDAYLQSTATLTPE